MPVLIPEFEVTFGRYQVRAVSRITVVLSRNLPCDTAEIELPMLAETDLAKLQKGGGALEGEVEINLGWGGASADVVFTGVIVEVSPEQPLTIKCCDHGQALRTTRFQKTFNEKNLGPMGAEETWYSEVAWYTIAQAGLQPIIPMAHNEAEGDLVRKSLTVDHQTCAQVLEKMRDNGWDFFVIPGTKKCYYGPPWPWAREILKQDRVFKFAFGGDAQEQNKLKALLLGRFKYAPIIEPDDLCFTPADKVGQVVVHFTDADFAAKGVHGKYPPDGGEPVKTFDFQESDIDEAKADTRARNLYLKHNSITVEGDIKIFGNQFIKHSERVVVKDPNHPERGGKGSSLDLWLDEVTHSYGPTIGFKTTLKLCQSQESR